MAHSTGSAHSKNVNVALYIGGVIMLCLGATYASAPLYKVLCQATGMGGEIDIRNLDKGDYIEGMEAVRDRKIKVVFNADVHSQMKWHFKPQQHSIDVFPGETALAFFTATNPTDVPIIGISTYNVVPFEAAPYFNKIQCFCFEEQRLNPKEQVDMPVFFFIDPDFDLDHRLIRCDEIILSYTFFEAKDDLELPAPNSLSNVKTYQPRDDSADEDKESLGSK